VCSLRNLKIIEEHFRLGLILAVMLAPPCSSFSLARNRYPVRSAQYPAGLPHLRDHDRESVRVGNLCFSVSVYVISLCNQYRVPFAMENPMGSYMWRQEEFLNSVLPSATILDIHQCAFGSRWRKATKLVLGNDSETGKLATTFPQKLKCHGKHGYCSFREGHKHFVLEGKTMTSRAAEYPTRLSRFLAQILLNL